ncbi:MAG TPA: ATP-binding protein [Thermoanaerobaculia bacterium]|nr:ATP-binding protein [Thermoanaerobaculia bacterium]
MSLKSESRWLPADARRIAIFVAGYSVAFLASYGGAQRGAVPAPLWAPDAVLLCALLLNPPRKWWAFLLLAVPIRLAIGMPLTNPLHFLADTANDLVKAVLAAACLRRIKPGGGWLSSPESFAIFGAIAVLAVPALSAFAGAGRLFAERPRPFWPTWAGWFLGDALANLLLTPLILSFADRSSPLAFRPWRRTAEIAAVLAAVLVLGAVAFAGGGFSLPEVVPLLFLPFPFLLWSAIRLGVRGTSAALTLLAASGIWAVGRWSGHFSPEALRASLFSLELFLLVVGSSLLFLAVVLEERRSIERNLRSTQARLARAEAASMVMVVHAALDGAYLRVPRKLSRLLGYPRQEMIRKSWMEMTPAEDVGAQLRESERLLAGEIESFQLQKRLLRSDGETVWLYLSRSLVRGPEGPLHFLDYLTDISEIKRAEAEARLRENELGLFAEHSPAAVAVLDSDHRFVMASRRFRKDFQKDDRPIVGRGYAEALAGFPRSWPEAFRRSLEGSSEACDEDSFTRPDGTTEFLRWEIVPGASIRGGRAGSFLFAELTTDRKRGEHALDELRRQLAHLMRVSILGELSGALAHELSQPLAAILANAQAAQTYITRGQSGIQEVTSILEDIVSDDLRASEVIRSLRNLLRKGETEFREIDLNHLIREALELAQSDVITKNVSVGLQLAPDLPEIRGDRVQLEQVLLNLIVNACEAMAGGNCVERKLRIETHTDEDDTVHVMVQDTGPGVDPEVRDRLFEPFLTTKAFGLGLGLTICRSLVIAHGGRLWHAPVAGGGAAFHVVLPRTAGEE